MTFTLSNTGQMAADEVVQLYVHRVDATVEWPEKELKAFRRVALQPGASQQVTLTVPVEQLKYWDEAQHDWALEHGQVELLIGASAGDIRLRAKAGI